MKLLEFSSTVFNYFQWFWMVLNCFVLLCTVFKCFELFWTVLNYFDLIFVLNVWTHWITGCMTGCVTGCVTGCMTGCMTGCVTGCVTRQDKTRQDKTPKWAASSPLQVLERGTCRYTILDMFDIPDVIWKGFIILAANYIDNFKASSEGI